MRRRVWAYVVAIAAVAAAAVLRSLLDPVFGDAMPFVTMFGAVAAAVWVGGYGPGIAASLLGYAACNYYFIAPRHVLELDRPGHALGMVAYLFTCSLIIAFGEAMRIARNRAGERRELLRVTLRSIGDAVITTDVEGRITSVNAAAEALTGFAQQQALGRPLDSIFRIINEETRRPVESPATKALREGVVVGLANHTVLIGKDGSEHPIDDSAAPIREESGRVSGCVLVFRDVSVQRRLERDRADQLLTARLLASIVESSDDAIIRKNLDGVIQSWNAAAERLFGYSAEQAVGRHISLVIPPERISEEDHIVATLKAGRRIEHYETERVRSDGRRLWVSLTISPVKDEAGNVIGASKIVRDVTLQRGSEERVRRLLIDAAAANAKFRAFFEQGALYAGIMDVHGIVLEPNRRAWEEYGYSKDDVLGKPFHAGPWWAGSPELSSRVKAAVAQAAAGGTFRGEMPYFTADGHERVTDLTIQPIRDESGKVVFLAATGIDVTERKRAEADREKFVTLVESSTDFIGICDLQGIPYFVNRAGLELVGLADVEEARRTPVLDFFFPEDQQSIAHEFFPAVLEKGHGEIEVRFRHFKTGAARWMAYKVLTLNDAVGRPSAFATVSQDVTERKRMEDDLRRLAADLSDSNRRKDEFLAMLSHELRNSLAPISNAVQVLRLGTDQREPVHSTSEMLNRQVRQMARLVDDLLDMSRITRGKIELRRERIELAPVLHQAVEAVRALAKYMGHEIEVELPRQPVFLSADPTRLAQIVGNLLHNACKFTEKSGRISLVAEREREHVVVRVRDTGIGISAEQLPRLFEMFMQVDTSLERSRDGLGVGLTLVKTLVELHGGTIEVRSEGLGRGSEFLIRLPILQDAPESAPAAVVRAPSPAAGRKILIVDDNEDGAKSLAMLLELDGYEAHIARDGLEALASAERIRPDAVLLDIGLPRLNGYEACRRLRRQPWGKELTILALTGWGQEEDRRQAKEAGFDEHLAKPVDHDVLVKLLASLPTRRAAR